MEKIGIVASAGGATNPGIRAASRSWGTDITWSVQKEQSSAVTLSLFL